MLHIQAFCNETTQGLKIKQVLRALLDHSQNAQKPCSFS